MNERCEYGSSRSRDYSRISAGAEPPPPPTQATKPIPWWMIALGATTAVFLGVSLVTRSNPKIEAAIEAGKKRYKEAYPTRASRRAHEAEIATAVKEWRAKGWRPGQPIPK